MTNPEHLQRRAEWQNHAIELADVRLESAELPTYTEVLLALDALASSTEGNEITTARNAAIDIVMRATGTPGTLPAFWIQRYGRVKRPPSIHTIVRDICPDAQFKDVAPYHERVIVPAAYVEQVREAIERVRRLGFIYDVEAAPQ